MGATASDHGHPSARTENLSYNDAEQLFKDLSEDFNSEDADQFRGQMLTEMAKMSCEDGLLCKLSRSEETIPEKFLISLVWIKVLISQWRRTMSLT